MISASGRSAFGVDHGPVAKSLVGGVFKPASKLTRKERAAVGGYKQARGVSEAHQEFKTEAAQRRKMFPKGSPAEQTAVGAQHVQPGMKSHGVTYRLGSAKGGRSHIVAAGHTPEDLRSVMGHERLHAAPKRSEYRLHGQIIKDPVKTMREEARADVGSDMGHYRSAYKKIVTNKPVSMYQASAATRDPKYIRQVYPHMSQGQARRGAGEYRKVQNKIVGKPPMSRKKKAVLIGAGTTVTGAGGLAHHTYTKPKQTNG